MTFFLLPFSFFLSLFALLLSGCVRWTPPAMVPVDAGGCRSASLQWFAPDSTPERHRLDRWCAGVGGAAVQPLGATGSPPIRIEDITFVSWNVHVGSGDVRAFVSDLRKGDLAGGRKVGHYVLLLQEAVRTDGVPALAENAAGAGRIDAHRDAASADILQIARELGLSLVYVPSMRNGGSDADPPEDRGNAILSTLPLSDLVAVELPGERQRRVVIIAHAETVSVGAVHLDALGSGSRRLWVFWTPWLREVQVRSMASRLPDGPLVIGGDLNTWHGRGERAVRFLDRLQDATPVSVDRPGLSLRVLDYLFFRTGKDRRAHYRQVGHRYGSDHSPLVGWVE